MLKHEYLSINKFAEAKNASQFQLVDREQQKILVSWNDTKTIYADYDHLHQLIEKQATSTPDTIAVCFENAQITYEELNQRANLLARHLDKVGIGPDILVGVCMERSLELVIALLAVLKAGGAYVPLDPGYPQDRLAYMIADAQIPLVLTQETVAARISLQGVPAIVLDSGELETNLMAQTETANLNKSVQAENLAYMIYTSGSTGKPKGAMNRHRSIHNRLVWMQDTYQLSKRDRVLQKTPFSFDVSVWEFFWPLSAGACLVMARPDSHKDPAYLKAIIIEQAITTLHFVPAMLQTFLLEPDLQHISSIRQVMCSGEALSAELQTQFFVQFAAPVQLYNLYGPTEAAIDVTAWTCQRTTQEARSVPIGHPIANTQLYILDASLQPTAPGITGELYIGGIGLARGYYRRPELTAERFIPNPFSQEAGTLLYRTGDLAFYRPDGAIEYVGRSDHQVKLRGFRIELGEIEATLQQQPGILQAIVIVREDNPRDKRLVAYLLTPNTSTSGEALRVALKEKLPDYMLPATFVFLQAFPLSPSGKVDRRALPIPDNAPNRQEHPPQAARNPLEAELAHIWTMVLNIQQISMYDNFFELGGHSLLVAQVIARLRQSLHIEVPNRSLFEMPTIATLAPYIETLLQIQQPSSTATELELVPLVRPHAIPASFAQQSLWFIQQLESNSVVYNLPAAYRLEGPLDISALEQSLNALVLRHEVLRTTFADHDGQATQVILSNYRQLLPVIDISELSEEGRETRIRQLAHQESQTPFNLATGPLLRTWLLRLDEHSHVLLLNIHHIISDGWSSNILLRDLTALYQMYVQGQESSLPVLPIQYADYALWQKQVLQGQVLRDHLNYWQQHLAGTPHVSTLPTDRARPSIQTGNGAQQKIILPAQLLQSLKTLSQQEGVTLFMTLLATFQIVFMRSSGQTDFVLGTPVANRSYTEVENLLGYFVNTLALHCDLSGNPTFQQLLIRVRDVTLQAYAHQEIALEQVVQSLQIERSLSYTPLFQIMFSMQSVAQNTPSSGGLSWSPLEVESSASKFDLTFDAQEQAEGLRIKIEYNTDLYNADTIARLLTHWQVLLQSIIEDATQSIDIIPMLSHAERTQLLETWNATQVEYPAYTTLCQLFEAQVERRAHATAVCSNDGTLSYRELNEKANQLAHLLRKRGVVADTLVAICMERSTAMLVALLGILKAGGTYVPIDPTYPTNRIDYMLQDSQAPCLLTQQHLLPLLSSTTAKIICFDLEQDSIAQEARENVAHTGTADDLAYILYTSGSTGRPKGVQIPQRGLINFELAMRDLLKLSENDIFLAISTLSFDIAGLELFLPLICGAQVSIETREVAIDGHQLLRRLKIVRPTLLQATPATWRMLLSAGADDFSDLTILCGGEALSPELRDQILACKPAAFWNVYGPTETTVWSVVRKITSSNRDITIGRPIANMQTYILDTRQQPVPIGVSGELYIGGAGMGKGYVNQPALTQEKFIPHLFSTQPTERLYRTGDLASYREDGSIDFLGRIDHQVKIRGFRIELGEIETVLQQMTEIKQAVVIDREDIPGDKRLVAYMIARENLLTPQEIRAGLKEKLPDYMIPSAFVFLDAFKLTPNGKIDRQALPAPDMRQSTITTDRDDQPSEIMHYQLLTIWEELLAIHPIGIHDNFFDLGGHSLLATRMIARIEQVFGKKISLSTLFAGPTIEALTNVLRQQTQTTSQTPLIPVKVTGSGLKKPFFFLHGDWSGGAYYCFKLARKAGSDQPFYAIEPSIFPEDQEIPTIEGQAAAHLELIRSVQPEGPYYLGGYCNGAIIAYEMAQQLQAQGEHIEFLALIDPPYEERVKKFATMSHSILRLNQRQQWQAYLYTRHIFIRKIRPLLLRLAKKTDEQLMKSIQVSIEKDHAFTRLLPSMKTLREDYSSLFAWALQYYTCKPYHGKVTLIWASEQQAAEPNNPWNEHKQLEDTESHTIATTHDGILTDKIEDLAECLATVLQQQQ